MDDNQQDASMPSHASDEVLNKGYEIRDKVWQGIGRLDDNVLAHIINPSFMGMPTWPDLRQSYRVVHLDNGHTIIATDGLSDPFMNDHPFYKPNVNGFGLELYIEITEPFDMGKARYSWWYNLLYQEALQVAYSGDLLDKLNEYGGVLSTELYDVHGLPDKFKNEGRAPVLLGAPSNSVPDAVNGPLSLIRFVSIELLTLDELKHILDNGKKGRSDIARGLIKQLGGPVSLLDRGSVLRQSDIVVNQLPHVGENKPNDTEPNEQVTEVVTKQVLPSIDTSSTPKQIDLSVKQSWLEKSSDTALEEFKSLLSDVLNNLPEDRHTNKRWEITKISEGNAAYLIYDERPIATLVFENDVLHFMSNDQGLPRYDDVMYAIRYSAKKLVLAVYSNKHRGARLPQDYTLSLDHGFFSRDKSMSNFFEHSEFIPRYAPEGMENVGDGRQTLVIYSPYYVENKKDGSMHILNNSMLTFLAQKNDQRTNKEFSYKVADSMQDFARKYDLGLVPTSFYQSYQLPTKIINETYFDAFHINRKIFIDPYVWDFDDEHDYRYYQNIKNGMHLMDKVRKGEDLDATLRRVLREELQVADDYVGARIWGIEFDRDRDGYLTPRLKISVYVHGMIQKQRSQSHDWVSVK